jgi:hypothetical protein
MNIPYAISKQLILEWLSFRGKLGDVPAMKQVAEINHLNFNDVKREIKKHEKNTLKPKAPKDVLNFTGRATAKICDELWRQAVLKRAGYKCEKEGCTAAKGIQAHHVFPRTIYALRHDLKNGIALCIFHHLYWAHKNAVEFTEWIKTKRDIPYLESRKHNRSRNDYEAIRIDLKKSLEK